MLSSSLLTELGSLVWRQTSSCWSPCYVATNTKVDRNNNQIDTMVLKHVAFALLGCSIFGKTSCWSATIQFHRHPSLKITTTRLGKQDNADSSDPITQIMDTVDTQPAAFGVSYIGGDPCGSRYNDDPFDASKDVVKPGMPDEMKDRIAAMAAEMLRKQQNKDES